MTVLSDNNKGATTRPYTGYDKNFMVALALSSCNISGVVFALYLNSPQVSLLYSNPDYLWITFVALILGASWMALQAYRGQMAHDPIIFIIYDKVFSYLFNSVARIFDACMVIVLSSNYFHAL